MNYQSIADIYAANHAFRQQLLKTLHDVSADEAVALPFEEKWSIAQVAEHVSLVGLGASRICSKLLRSAANGGAGGNGTFSLTGEFSAALTDLAARKVDAPEMVHPTGLVSISQSTEKLKTSSDALDLLRPEFERHNVSTHKYPHPYLGDLSAAEWLILVGLHEQRHTRQIENIIDRLRQ